MMHHSEKQHKKRKTSNYNPVKLDAGLILMHIYLLCYSTRGRVVKCDENHIWKMIPDILNMLLLMITKIRTLLLQCHYLLGKSPVSEWLDVNRSKSVRYCRIHVLWHIYSIMSTSIINCAMETLPSYQSVKYLVGQSGKLKLAPVIILLTFSFFWGSLHLRESDHTRLN